MKKDMEDTAPEFNHKTWIFSVIKKDFFSIPISIRMVSLSSFLFVLWWGLWGDTFFSVYLESIVNNIFWVSMIAALIPLVRMIFAISIGELDDHSNIRSIIFLGKWVYFIASIFFFFAGITQSVLLLVIACVLTAFAGAALLTSYQSFIRKYASKQNRSIVFGLYFSSINLAYVVGALIAAVLIQYIALPYLFLFIAVFSAISFFTDTKLPNLSKKKIKEFLGKESFLHNFFREIFSLAPIKKSFITLKNANKKLYNALGFEFLFNVLSYIGFIFIPIIAVKSNLSLSEIAIIFAIMRFPYVISFFTWEFADKYNKRKFILIALLFLSFLFALLGFQDNFGSIMIISFGIALGLSAIRPVISWLISDYTEVGSSWKVTWIQEFMVNFWSMFGSIAFGVLTLMFGMENSFLVIGIVVFLIAVVGIIRRFHLFQKKIHMSPWM